MGCNKHWKHQVCWLLQTKVLPFSPMLKRLEHTHTRSSHSLKKVCVKIIAKIIHKTWGKNDNLGEKSKTNTINYNRWARKDLCIWLFATFFDQLSFHFPVCMQGKKNPKVFFSKYTKFYNVTLLTICFADQSIF